jgi:ATP-binding cassette subfamily B protein
MALNPDLRRKVFLGLWTAAWSWRRRTLLALGLLVLAKVAGVCVPLLLKAIVDRFSQPSDLSADNLNTGQVVLVLPVFLLLGYALLRFAGTLFTELRDLVFARVTQRTVKAFAERTFGHLLSLSPRFHVQRNTGSLIRDVERGTAGIGFLLGAGLFTVVPTLVEFVGVLLVMSVGYSHWFTVAIVLTFAVYATYTMLMTQKRELRQRAVNEMDSRANGRLVDTLLNYETVKAYAREQFERTRYAEICTQWIEGSVRNQKALSALHLGQGAIIAAGVASVMLLAGEQTVRGAMTVGDLVLVNSYVIQICLPLNALGFVFREAKDALVNTEKLFGLLEQQPEIVDAPGSRQLGVPAGHVAFEHVDFAYESGRPILHDVSFSIGAGQTVAVVGGSGSGKSTLARLLLRLYDTNAGRITIDGQDVREVQLASLRQAIGVVPQDTVLFNDTIAYNIGYGRTGAGMHEVVEAAQAAQVHEFILSLPQQYDTVVGERGMKLSGGEKQRIAIARAFLKNPPIMVLDEATSALDTRAERAIQNELDRIAQGRTTLIIAHRLSTIVNADEIIVLDKGRIVERGRHQDLMQREGLYAQLWKLQREQQQFERLERELALQPLNLAVLAASVIDGLREAFDARQVRLYTDIETDRALVTGDPGSLSQALRELCLQSLAATPVDGRIELRLESGEGSARLSVTDGRHVTDRPLVLVDPTTRLDTDTPPDPLALRSLVERQGGRFLVETPTSMRGMRYVIELPLRHMDVEPVHAQRPIESAVASLQQPLKGLHVACIDDQSEAREVLQAVLEQAGAQVTTFAGGRLALDWLEQAPGERWPQVIVCDIALGEEDGHAVVRRIRQVEARRGVALHARVPAIALTGLAQPGDRIRALMAGFQVHLAKPVEPQALIGTIYTLSGRGTQEEARSVAA